MHFSALMKGKKKKKKKFMAKNIPLLHLGLNYFSEPCDAWRASRRLPAADWNPKILLRPFHTTFDGQVSRQTTRNKAHLFKFHDNQSNYDCKPVKHVGQHGPDCRKKKSNN